MEWEQRIEILAHWGKLAAKRNWLPVFNEVSGKNPWFGIDQLELAFKGILRYLDPNKLQIWLKNYAYSGSSPKTVGVIMAGNIPLVGVHDVICCYLCGHQVVAKPSRHDHAITSSLISMLLEIDPLAKSSITFTSDLQNFNLDAIIATGSDNSNRYFQHRFGKIPGIIRHNRSSVGILRGNETTFQLRGLGMDVMSYYGRGCRNISKLLVPEKYDFSHFVKVNQPYRLSLENQKYFNNYRYQKALYQMQQVMHTDTGYLLISENESLVSPLAVLYFEYYSNYEHMTDLLLKHHDKTQCIASAEGWYEGSLNFGTLQSPELWDYADGVDTMQFLMRL